MPSGPVIRPGPQGTWPGNWSSPSSSIVAAPVQGTADLSLGITLSATGISPSQGSANFEITFVMSNDGQGVALMGLAISMYATGAAISRVVPIHVLTSDQILTGNRNTRFYLDILDQTDAPIGRLDGVTDGKLDWVSNAVIKGAGEVTVIDVSQDVDWLTARIRPVMVIEGFEPQHLGVFLVSEAPESWGNGRKWDIKLLDKTTILDQDTVSETYALVAGSIATDAVISLIVSAGISNYAVTDSSKTLAADMVWAAGTSKMRIINDLLDSINYFSLFSNFEGQVVAEPYTLPANRPLVYEFVDGRQSIYSPEFGRDVDYWNIPNRVTLIGIGDGTTEALTSTVDNTDPNSPYSIASRGRVIGRVETGVEAADQATLDALALVRLIQLTSPTSGVEVSHAPVPGLAINQAARFRREPAGIDARHVISKTSLTLNGTALAVSTLTQVVDL